VSFCQSAMSAYRATSGAKKPADLDQPMPRSRSPTTRWPNCARSSSACRTSTAANFWSVSPSQLRGRDFGDGDVAPGRRSRRHARSQRGSRVGHQRARRRAMMAKRNAKRRRAEPRLRSGRRHPDRKQWARKTPLFSGGRRKPRRKSGRRKNRLPLRLDRAHVAAAGKVSPPSPARSCWRPTCARSRTPSAIPRSSG